MSTRQIALLPQMPSQAEVSQQISNLITLNAEHRCMSWGEVRTAFGHVVVMSRRNFRKRTEVVEFRRFKAVYKPFVTGLAYYARVLVFGEAGV